MNRITCPRCGKDITGVINHCDICPGKPDPYQVRRPKPKPGPAFDFRRKRPYLPKPNPFLARKKAMTIALGFKCADGVVLAADSQLTGAISKWPEKKIHSFPKSEIKCEPHFAYTSDDVDFAKNVITRLATVLKTAERGHSELIPAVRGELKKIHKEYSRIYPKKEERPTAEILLALYDPEMSLYLLRGVEAVPIMMAEYIGWGEPVARSTADPLFSPSLKTYEAARLAVYAVLMAKKYAKYVGKSSDVVILQNRAEVLWGPTDFWLKEEEIQEMENDFDGFLNLIAPVLLGCYFEKYGDPESDNFEGKLKSFSSQMKKQHRKYRRRAKLHEEDELAFEREIQDEFRRANPG